jgi:hypothetical protein
MMRPSTAFGIGLMFIFAGVALLFTLNPWAATLPVLVGVALCWLACIETEPVESEFDRRLREAEHRYDRDRMSDR